MRYVFDAKRFAKDLHLARWERGMSMEDLASRVGGSKAAICRYENARQVPPLVTAIVIGWILDLQISDYIMRDLEGQQELPGFENETEGELFGEQTLDLWPYNDVENALGFPGWVGEFDSGNGRDDGGRGN